MKMQLGVQLVEIFRFPAPHFHKYEGRALMCGPVGPSKCALHLCRQASGLYTPPHAHVCVHTYTHPFFSPDQLPLQSHQHRLRLTPTEDG